MQEHLKDLSDCKCTQNISLRFLSAQLMLAFYSIDYINTNHGNFGLRVIYYLYKLTCYLEDNRKKEYNTCI